MEIALADQIEIFFYGMGFAATMTMIRLAISFLRAAGPSSNVEL